MKKSTKLFILLIGLIIVSVLIAFTGNNERKVSFESDLFAVQDTTAISRITIENTNTKVIERQQGFWSLNDKHRADANLIQVIESILKQVSIKRPVSRLNHDEILNDLEENGSKVKISFNDGSEYNFIAGGDASKKNSYFSDGERAYVVQIPGYNNYLSGIFELSINQWRDRLLFTSSWRSLLKLNIDFSNDGRDLNIEFKDKFLSVKGVEKIDTTALLDYVNQYQFFQINDFLEKGKYPRYDSLLDQEPMATLEIKDIDQNKDMNLKVYPLIKGERFYLVSNNNEEMMVIDTERMEKLFAKNAQFKLK